MQVEPEVVTIVLGILGVSQAGFFYWLSAIKTKFREARVERDKLISGVDRKEELLELRIRHLETHAITETKTKQLIDEAVKPLRDSVDEMKAENKENHKELSNRVTELSINLSTFLGEMRARLKEDLTNK